MKIFYSQMTKFDSNEYLFKALFILSFSPPNTSFLSLSHLGMGPHLKIIFADLISEDDVILK